MPFFYNMLQGSSGEIPPGAIKSERNRETADFPPWLSVKFMPKSCRAKKKGL